MILYTDHLNFLTRLFLYRIHAQGNAAKLRNHPDGRAIMFEGPIYSKKTIVDFITALNGFEDILKLIERFSGK